MSRIGKQPVVLSQGVTFTVSKDNLVTIKGPKGSLTQQVDRDIKEEFKDNELLITRPTDQIRHRAMHGLYRSLLNNMVIGVTTGFKKKLELVGVGYKAANTGNLLDLAMGYSHNILFDIPKEISITTETLKGQNPKIMLEGVDNQLLGAVAAKIRSLRKPEPYKGKGVRYSDEFIRRKAGKAAGK